MKHTTVSFARRSQWVLLGCLYAFVLVMLTACNTTEGIGKDVKSVGKGVEEAASDAKK